MRKSVRRGVRAAALVAVSISLSVGVPATGHENHEELGAGPGPAVEAANAAAEEKAAAAAIHGNMAVVHEQAMEQHAEAAERNKTFSERLVSWFGRLHTLLVHFPIAMFVGALGVELFGLWRGNRDYERAAHVMLVVGTIGAVAAAILGWFAGGFYLTDRNMVLMVHRWLGTAIALAGVLLLYVSATARRAPDRPRILYWAALGAMTVAIAVQGYLGGTFMHGGMSHMAF
jgi:uncharacterized membrane protein